MKNHISQTQYCRPYPLVVESTEGAATSRPTRRPRLYAHWTVGTDGKLICRWEAEL
ncbi:MAG TPA: hypothetical protein V6D29_13065 [Leptolyngbyaceae cyanobacterium]